MKKFHFRLETLLNYRSMQKEQEQLRYAEATRVLQEKRNQLKELENRLSDGIVLFQQAQQETRLTIDKLTIFQYYLNKSREGIKQQLQQVEQAQQVKEECFHLLEQAVKAYEAVEQLKTKQRQQYQAEVMAEEQKYLDEIGIQNYVRRD